MAHARIKLILTGGRAGQTVMLGNFQFVDGVTFVDGDAAEISGKITYLGRCYKAWPEGSLELAHFQRLDQERINGAGKTNAGAGRGTPGEVQGGVQSHGRGSSEAPTDNGSGAGSAASGSEGSIPGGDGHQDSGNAQRSGDQQGRAGETEVDFQTRRLIEAVQSLDHTNDEHWTQDGRPRMDAVERAYGSADVNRTDVEMAVPGFNRAVASEAAA